MSHYDNRYLHDLDREDSEAEQERIDARLAIWGGVVIALVLA